MRRVRLHYGCFGQKMISLALVLIPLCHRALPPALFDVIFVLGVKLRQQAELLEPAAQEEDREEEISGAQFLCETVIRSLTLEEAPDHRPRCRAQHSTHKPKREDPPSSLSSSTLLPEGCGTQSFLILLISQWSPEVPAFALSELSRVR